MKNGGREILLTVANDKDVLIYKQSGFKTGNGREKCPF